MKTHYRIKKVTLNGGAEKFYPQFRMGPWPLPWDCFADVEKSKYCDIDYYIALCFDTQSAADGFIEEQKRGDRRLVEYIAR